MAKTNRARDSERAGYTRAEKRLIALVWAIACVIVFLLLRR
jgi:hypothetical protein